jgi:hypothetical protein
MIPASVSILPETDTAFVQKLEDFLGGIHYGDVIRNPIIETPAHIVLADGNTISELKVAGQKFCGIEIALPSLGYLDISEKYLLGERGALFLLEQIINGLRYL